VRGFTAKAPATCKVSGSNYHTGVRKSGYWCAYEAASAPIRIFQTSRRSPSGTSVGAQCLGRLPGPRSEVSLVRARRSRGRRERKPSRRSEKYPCPRDTRCISSTPCQPFRCYPGPRSIVTPDRPAASPRSNAPPFARYRVTFCNPPISRSARLRFGLPGINAPGTYDCLRSQPRRLLDALAESIERVAMNSLGREERGEEERCMRIVRRPLHPRSLYVHRTRRGFSPLPACKVYRFALCEAVGEGPSATRSVLVESPSSQPSRGFAAPASGERGTPSSPSFIDSHELRRLVRTRVCDCIAASSLPLPYPPRPADPASPLDQRRAFYAPWSPDAMAQRRHAIWPI